MLAVVLITSNTTITILSIQIYIWPTWSTLKYLSNHMCMMYWTVKCKYCPLVMLAGKTWACLLLQCRSPCGISLWSLKETSTLHSKGLLLQFFFTLQLLSEPLHNVWFSYTLFIFTVETMKSCVKRFISMLLYILSEYFQHLLSGFCHGFLRVLYVRERYISKHTILSPSCTVTWVALSTSANLSEAPVLMIY